MKSQQKYYQQSLLQLEREYSWKQIYNFLSCVASFNPLMKLCQSPCHTEKLQEKGRAREGYLPGPQWPNNMKKEFNPCWVNLPGWKNGHQMNFLCDSSTQQKCLICVGPFLSNSHLLWHATIGRWWSMLPPHCIKAGSDWFLIKSP